ncbi:5'-3' exonuclease [Candidatus Nardonella dryophthoridicola]|uniref:Flap endonuclease n=1 Tax=endosymbiont of Metamasius hemipterus TaxID=204627 RepID=A0ABT0TW83_9GAMM|nr:5'-3' exonuclease H3TH domain-containing protein [Candidatus Nardonella dryophthoridicola]MCM0158255.1 flap endonuclease [endosymbiont of Metamasius hemipterus]
MNNNILILDGTFHAFKAYYSFINIDNFDMIYGMKLLFKKIFFNIKPKYIIIVFDHPGNTYRNIIYNKYKINRKKCSNDFIYQINKLKNFIKNMNIQIISIPSVEADDVIGTISKQCERNGLNVLISTCDKDMYQLISNKIKIINIYNNIIIDNNFIINKYGIDSLLMIDYMSLVGDISDNIKGVIGIGPKIANILLNKIGNINKIYNNLNYIYNIKEIKNPKFIIKILKNYKNNVINALQLIKINTNIFIGYKLYDMKINYNKKYF